MKPVMLKFLLMTSFILLFIFIIIFQNSIYARNKEGRILFTSEGYLWAVTPDGSDEENLCDISEYSELTLSPEKDKIAGIKDHDIYVMKWDGSSSANITRSPEIESINSFSPDGAKIISLLKSKPEDMKGGLGIALVNGTKYTKIDDYEIGINQDICWSPDSGRIIFTFKNKLYMIPFEGDWIKDLGTEKLKALSPYSPSWSPDGKRLAFRASNSGVGDLFLMNIESEYFRSLYSSECHSARSDIYSAKWSPGGEALVFEAPHPKDVENSIYMIYPDGSSLKLLGKGFEPEWSPDGTRIFYKTIDHKMKAVETGINSYNSKKIYPAYYSPDQSKIVYTNENTKEAWILDLVKKENIFLTGGNVNSLGWIEH